MPKYIVEVDGVRHVLEGDHPPSEDEARSAIPSSTTQESDSRSAQDFTQPSADELLKTTEQGISSRGSAIKNLYSQIRHPIQYGREHPFLSVLNTPAAAFEAQEALRADPALALQRGHPEEIPADLWKTLKGERPAQIGDVGRAAGYPEPVNVAMGLMLAGGTKGRFSPATKTAANAGEFATSQIERAVQPATRSLEDLQNFPYNKTIQVQQGMIDYFRNLNKWYGKQFDRVANQVKGPIQTNKILPIIQARLQQWGLVDQTGQPLQGVHPDFGAAKDEVMRIYQDLGQSALVTWKRVATDLRSLRQVTRVAAQNRNVPINQSERLASQVAGDLGRLLETYAPGFKTLNQTYSKKRQFFDTANKVFAVFKGEYQTGRGETILAKVPRLRVTNQGTYHLLEQIEKETKIPILKPAEIYAGFQQITRGVQRAPIFLGTGNPYTHTGVGIGIGSLPDILLGVKNVLKHTGLPQFLSPREVLPQLGLAGVREVVAAGAQPQEE